MLALTMLAAQLAAASPGVTPDQVGRLAPQELGARLLATGPGPIVEAHLYNEALAPPSAPGQPTITRIMLYERARPGFAPDLCEKVRHLVRLRPVLPGRDGALPPAPAAADSPTTLYRLRPTAAGAECEARGDQFLSVGDGDAGLVFSNLRALAAMQADPTRLRDIMVTVDDELGRAGTPAPGEPGPLTDAVRALRAFPTSEVDGYRFRSGGAVITMTFQAGAWSVELASGENSYATARVAVRRSLPPPPP